YVIAKHAQGGTRPIVSYTYWTDNAKMTTDARGTTIVDSDRLVTGQAAGYPWNMKKLKSYDSKTGHAFVAVMTIKYRNTVLNGMGVRCGKLADTHTLIRIPAANMVDQKK
ncbi:LVIS_2131 family protein, partial [Mordavella massiliensis]|nr:LVIS_2131 family protein [Mordavella massiliensis]